MRKMICLAIVGTDPERVAVGVHGSFKWTFRVITRSRFKRENERDDPDAVWVTAVIWGDRGDKLAPHIEKGKRLLIMGDLSAYQKKDGTQGLEIRCENVEFIGADSGGHGGGGGSGRRGGGSGDARTRDGSDVPF